MLRNEASRDAGLPPGRMAAPDDWCPRRTTLAALAVLLPCTGAGRVVTDIMPACVSGWQPAWPVQPGSQPAGAWRYDAEVDVDATLVVRAADGRIVAVLHEGEHRAWTCHDRPQAPALSS